MKLFQLKLVLSFILVLASLSWAADPRPANIQNYPPDRATGINSIPEVWPMPGAEDFYTADFLVNDDYQAINQNYPAVAYDGAGNYIVAWQDSINGNWDIYAQSFNSEGAALGLQFKVNASNALEQQEPAVLRMTQGILWWSGMITATTERLTGTSMPSAIILPEWLKEQIPGSMTMMPPVTTSSPHG